MTRPRLYRFKTTWRIAASRERVWEAVTATPSLWPQWWEGLKEVRDITMTSDITGSSFYCTWQSWGYQLHCKIWVNDVEHPQHALLHAEGDLQGVANCSFTELPDGTTEINMDWQVHTTKRWMNLLGPALAPIFTYNHHVIMRQGERGLRHYLLRQSKSPE